MKQMQRFLIAFFAIIVLQNTLLFSATQAAEILPKMQTILQSEAVKTAVGETLADWGKVFLRNFAGSLGLPLAQPERALAPVESSAALRGKTIAVDPGHGGANPGAVRYDLRESDNNLAVSLKLAKLLEAQGAQVVLTRASDQAVTKDGAALRDELQARVDLAAAKKADIFVSVHTNSAENTAVNGAMTFYYNETSLPLAKSIQKAMVAKTGAADKGEAYGNFLVLRNSKIPAVLVEMGFITNRAEAEKLASGDYRDRMAAGIAEGIAAYFKTNGK